MRPPSLSAIARTVPWVALFSAIGVLAWFAAPIGAGTEAWLRPHAIWFGQQVGLSTPPIEWTPQPSHPSPELENVWDLTVPIRGPFRVSSTYGWRVHPVYGNRRFHNGVDLAVPVGTAIHSPQGGWVSRVSEDGRSGKYLSVDHGEGVVTTYCHLDSTAHAVGDVVEQGEIIARSGNTGASTGPHLHWIVKVDGSPIDPMFLLEAAADAE